jgi:hypothetical protein
MPDARFIIGTGRCGSTLLSRMLRLHPRVLELSELFVGLDWSMTCLAFSGPADS